MRNRGLLLLIVIFMVFSSISNSVSSMSYGRDIDKKFSSFVSTDTYTPINTNPLNIQEEMTLSPIFTPDNALEVHAAWIEKANTTIELQNQYIRAFDDPVDWSTDSNPLVSNLVEAANRGVQIRVQVREDSDDDFVGPYLDGITNIQAKYMGSQTSSPDENWLSNTHNKILIIDGKVSLVSSINYGGNAFLNNREAGMVIQSNNIADYYQSFFEEDWNDGEAVSIPLEMLSKRSENDKIVTNFQSHTNIPKQNFTGLYNVSAYVNPDNADKLIFDYLESAKQSIYVSMYTISRQDFVDTLIGLKQNNPSIDIQVLISRDRVGPTEDEDTFAAAEEFVENLIPVYNSTDGLNYYHNKYWIIDQKHTFIYSGNWSPRSVTDEEQDGTYTSSFPNRDMGIAVHDAPDIANFVKTEVWDKDVEVASAWDLPVGIKQTSLTDAEVVEGEITLSAIVSGLTDVSVFYRFGTTTFTGVELDENSFSITVDTTTIENGITEFEVKAETSSQVFTDLVTINVVNIPASDNWRFLVTEVHPDPNIDSDTKAEFFELTNSFPFDLYLEGWQVGDDDDGLHTFADGDKISAYTSLIIARDAIGFENGFGKAADIELSYSLSNDGDFVKILNQKGEYVDVVAFGNVDALDGSETVDKPSAGQSINRFPLHVDTNLASDFEISDPTPAENVPQIPLGEAQKSSSDTTSDDLPWSFVWIILGILPLFLRRKQK